MKKYSIVRVDIFDGRETEEVVLENLEKEEAEREAYILGDSAQTGTYYEVRRMEN